MKESDDSIKILFRLKSGQVIKPGWRLPRNAIISDNLPNKSFILTNGRVITNIKKDTIPVLITGVDYIIGTKPYDLSSGYVIKAIVENGVITPILRKSVGAEQFAGMKLIKEQRKPTRREGQLINWWPEIIKEK